MKSEREERARAHLNAYGWQSTLEQGAAFVRMLLAFEDEALRRVEEGLNHFGWDETAGKAVVRAMKGDGK